MKLGVFAVLFGQQSFEQMLDTVAGAGLEAVEIGTGSYPGDAHCKPAELLADAGKLKAFKQAIESRGLMISSLSCHGNPLHPQKAIADAYHKNFLETVELANRLEVGVVTTFSGTPGDHEGALYPNWPVSPWPEDYSAIFDWQWEKKIIPYWSEQAKLADANGVKIALEMHGGFSVHTPGTALKLREAAGKAIGVNYDPSHMWWQGIDPVLAIRALGEAGAIHHFHAKDTSHNPYNTALYGVTDMQSHAAMSARAWIFRTVGFGHDMKVWADIMSELRLVGYDYVISIEHEDGLMSVEEGFRKAVANLQSVLIKESPVTPWWA
jgi:sugar phosphate isomerase/epimerase